MMQSLGLIMDPFPTAHPHPLPRTPRFYPTDHLKTIIKAITTITPTILHLVAFSPFLLYDVLFDRLNVNYPTDTLLATLLRSREGQP